MSSQPNPWGPRAANRRAAVLLQGGLLGAHASAAVAVVVAQMVRGGQAWAVSLLAAAVAILFHVLGQWVQVLWANADPWRLLSVSVLSYVIRVAGIGALLWVATAQPSVSAAVDDVAVAIGAVGAVLGWVIGEVVAHRRIHWPVYDTEYEPPADGDSTI